METGSIHPVNRNCSCTMKRGADTYIQWKQEHYDQDVIKLQLLHLLHPSQKNTQTNSIPPFLQNPPSQDPPTLQQFFHSPFLWIFGKVNPRLKRGEFKLCLDEIASIIMQWSFCKYVLSKTCIFNIRNHSTEVINIQ